MPNPPAVISEERMKTIELQLALDAIPTNWLDPLLTGPDKVVGDGRGYTGRDIERAKIDEP